MRILQVGAAFVGAQEKIEYAIHRYLQENKHKSFILYADGRSDDPNILSYESKPQNLIRRFLRKYIKKSPRCAWLVTQKLIRYIKKIQPDVVNLHILHHGYIDYIALLKFLARNKIPVVYTAHDMWAFTGGCYYYTDENCNGFQSGCIECPKKTSNLDCRKKETKKYFTKKMSLFAQLHKLYFVSVSPWVHEEMLKSELKVYPQHVIMNAIDDYKYTLAKITKTGKHHLIQA